LQTAVSNASDGDTIYVGTGTWSSTASYPLMMSDLTLVGQGKGLTKLAASTEGYLIDAHDYLGVGLTLQGLTLQNAFTPVRVEGRGRRDSGDVECGSHGRFGWLGC
jgi:hypothetical protein